MKKQQGFTLIELIMVIVVLGILSAFALPRFVDFSSGAETASLEGSLGSVRSASAIAHAQALATGTTGATGTVSLEGVNISLVHGYPAAGSIGDAAGLDGFEEAPITGGVIVHLGDGKPCFTYAEPTGAGTAPTITYDDSFVFDDDDDTCAAAS
ncbi:type II secretion system protein [Saccharospirillum sp. HFRX-1]|uniref:type II secretion system protein n=1 Tax=unclassified Saccharospirillum TaxID=2633430 RepID=UPI00372226C3